MTAPVRLGILGCGRIVHKFAPGVLQSQAASLVAIASRRPGAAESLLRELSAKHPGALASPAGPPRCFTSYEALLADPAIDAVYIPATGDEHAPLTLAAARAGKHVLCEKPLAPSLAEAEQMVSACRDAGVVLQEAFMWRHHPRATRTKELIDAGAIGALRLVNVSFSFQLKPDDWRMRPERGGGAMWDIGCYGVDAARFFTRSEPAAVYARARFAPTGVDLMMQLALRFPGDVFANIDCSFEAPWRCRLELVGDGGRIEWPMAFQHSLPVIHLWRTTQREAEPETIACEEANQFACQTTAFCRSIAAGRVVPPAEDGLANMRVLEQALKVARAES
jgi:xylose dehydrogenase (NAD/NADP)